MKLTVFLMLFVLVFRPVLAMDRQDSKDIELNLKPDCLLVNAIEEAKRKCGEEAKAAGKKDSEFFCSYKTSYMQNDSCFATYTLYLGKSN